MVAARREHPVSPLDASAKRLLGNRRLILAANRGPVSFAALADGSLRPRRGSGGVVTALSQVSSHVPLTWVASAMSEADRRAARSPTALDHAMPHDAVRLRFASVPRSVFEGAYNVIANPLLWFLQHELWNLPERPMVGASTMRAWREGYVALNRAFATAVLAEVSRRDRSPRIMLHDYHLYLAAEPIRRARPDAVLSHFPHIPWPSSSIWQVMPPTIREEICAGLLANDVVLPDPSLRAQLPAQRREHLPDAQAAGEEHVLHRGRRRALVPTPSPSTSKAGRSWKRRLESRAPAGAGAPRASSRTNRRPRRSLEPWKNIIRGFVAFERCMERYPSLRGSATFLAFLVPSRASMREYRDYGRRRPGCGRPRSTRRFGARRPQVVRIYYENDYAQALAGLAIADVILVNPLIDGMNLVAKEAAVVNQRDGVLVLSETAGAYDQMADGVLPVAPVDLIGTAEAIARGLSMPLQERRSRLAGLRAGVEHEDITWWLRRQLDDLADVAEGRLSG